MDSKAIEKASITVAAKALGVSAKTIQRWVKSGKIQSIREDNRIFIPVDEIRARLQDKRASVEDIDQDKKEAVQTTIGHTEDKNLDVIPITRTHYEGLLTRLGQLEANQQLLLEYKEGLQVKEKALDQARENLNAQSQELAEIKGALAANSSELEEAKKVISRARLELEKLVEIRTDAERKAETLAEREAEVDRLRAENARLRLPWWRRWFLK
jgi:DNA-binding transcriptional MerR regulator